MKSFILLLLFCVSLLSLSCYKESANNSCTRTIDTVSLKDAVVLKQENFVFANTKFEGIGKIYQQKNNRYVVGLEQMNVAANADMQVYLSKTPGLSDASFKLYSTRAINGDQYYLLPAGFSIDNFDYILIMDDRQDNAIGTAALH